MSKPLEAKKPFQAPGMTRIETLACQVVLETPKRSTYSVQSYVRRSLIKEIETALRAAGHDVDAMRARMRELEKQPNV